MAVSAAALTAEEEDDEVEEIGVNVAAEVEVEVDEEAEGEGEEEAGQFSNHNKELKKSTCILSSPSSPALTQASLNTHSV